MMQAMIFAAGLGTRLKPLTDRIPKALVSVGGEPLLKRVIFQLKDAGFTRIVVNVHHFSKQIIDYLRDNKNFGMDIRISDESEKLLETGGGIKKAWPFFDQTEPILIHNVDILSNVDLKKFYQMESKELSDDSSDSMKEKAPLAARLLVSERKTKRYLSTLSCHDVISTRPPTLRMTVTFLPALWNDSDTLEINSFSRSERR